MSMSFRDISVFFTKIIRSPLFFVLNIKMTLCLYNLGFDYDLGGKRYKELLDGFL
jgi:hypothetical protein